jgi:uncharacterized membrane protein YdbT with pleckstrin-like domain
MSEPQPDSPPETELTPEQFDALVEFLRQIPLFAELRPSDFEALIPIVRSEVFAAGGEVYHQSEADSTLYIIQSGEVSLTHIDPQGAPNDVGTRGPGAWLGESSLLLGDPHDVTVRALTDVNMLVLSRKEFKEMYEKTPGLFARLTPKDENARKIHAPHYGWQGEDESVVVFVRQHKWALFRALLIPFGLFVVALAVAFILSQVVAVLRPLFLGLAILGPAGFGFFVFIDWADDYYVVTNKRLVHVDELPIIRKRREEAPLSSITEIQFARHSILAHLLDFGDLRVETFGGAVSMRDIPHPNEVKESIQREIERVKARARASERAAIRDELKQRIFSNTIAKPSGSEGEAASAKEEPSILRTILGAIGYFWPRLREVEGDSIIWRKHWVVLLRAAWPPMVGLLVTFMAFFVWFNRSPLLAFIHDDAWWIWIVLGLSLFVWYLWLFEDWRNDQYIITSNRIIEIQRTPFLLSETRREALLSKIQSTDLSIPSATARLLRYGTVQVRIPGSVIELKEVKNPAAVQTEITKRMAEFARRMALNEARGRRTELSDWFAAYSQIQQQGPPRPVTFPVPESTEDEEDEDNDST